MIETYIVSDQLTPSTHKVRNRASRLRHPLISSPIRWFATLLIAMLGTFNFASAQNIDWLKTMGGPSVEVAFDLNTDQFGNVYTTGRFIGAADFNPGTDSFTLTAASYDIFVSKLDNDGGFIWAKHIIGSGVDGGNAITADDSGNVYVVGYFAGTIDFDPGKDSFMVTSTGSTNAFVLKLDSAGQFVWAETFGGNGYCYGTSVAVDSAGNVYATGRFNNTVDFNQSANSSYNLTSNGKDDLFIVKLNGAGVFQWAKTFGGADTDYGKSITVDKKGNVYATGWFSDVVVFDSAMASQSTVTSAGNLDMYVLKLNTDGNFQWVKTAGGANREYGYSVTLDDLGHLYVTGKFEGTADFKPGSTGFEKTSTGMSDVFVTKYDTTGDLKWVVSFGSALEDYGHKVSTDRAGNIYVSGNFNAEANFNTTGGSHILKTNGGEDIYALKLDPSGRMVWVKGVGSPKGDNGFGISVDPSGHVFVGGSFDEIIESNKADSAAISITGKGRSDIFVMKIGCNDTSVTSLDILACNSYTFNGVTYTDEGTYIQRLNNQTGCDSIIEIKLSLKDLNPQIQINVFELSTTLPYATYQWLMNGNEITGATNSTYSITANGDYQVVVSDEDGCVDTSDVYEVTNYETGINQHITKHDLQVFPNPAQNEIRVNTKMNLDLVIKDIDGRILKQVKNKNHITIDELAEGVYFLEINGGGQRLKVEKIIKTNSVQ